MIAQLMFFALGFFVAALLTLLILPAVSRRAERLATRRLEMIMPLSMAEVAAERDQLRAEFAAEKRRIEQRSEALIEARARDMSELGRRAALLVGRDSELVQAKRDKQEIEAALQAAERHSNSLQAELASIQKEFYDASGMLERRTRHAVDLELTHRHDLELADAQRAVIAGLETRASGLEMRLDDLQREFHAQEAALAAKGLDQERATEDRDFTRAEAAALATRLAALQLTHDQQGERLREFEDEVVNHRRARLRAEAKAEAAEHLAADATKREQAARESLDRHSETTRAAERNLAQRIETLRSERSTLLGALETVRKEYAVLRQEFTAAKARPAGTLAPSGEKELAVVRGNGAATEPQPEEDLALLRQAIAEIGLEVSRLANTLDDEAGAGTKNPPAELARRLRALQDRSHRPAQTG